MAGLCLYNGAKLSIEGETCIHHNLQNPRPRRLHILRHLHPVRHLPGPVLPEQMIYRAHDLFGVYADSTSTITIGKGLTKQLISFQNVQQRGLYRKDIDVNEGHRELTDGKNWCRDIDRYDRHYEEIQEDELQEDEIQEDEIQEDELQEDGDGDEL